MQTVRKWLDEHPQYTCYQAEYFEDQKGGFGRKGSCPSGGRPEQLYVKSVEFWKDWKDEIVPRLYVTIKLFWDEDHQ